MDILVYLNAQRHMAALGIQGMFLQTPYGGTSTEGVYVTATNLYVYFLPKKFITFIDSRDLALSLLFIS